MLIFYDSISSHIYTIYNQLKVIEGSLEVKLPTIWTDGKAEVGRVSEEKKRNGTTEVIGGRSTSLSVVFGRRSEMEKVRRKEMQVREKVRKSQDSLWFSN